MLATLAAGESRIAGAGDGADVRSTAAICARARRERRADRCDDAAGNAVDYRRRSPGVDGLREPAADLDCGNSGTSLRLFAGHPRRPALPERPRRRRFIATPSGRSYHRTAALDGRGAARPVGRLPSAGHRDRSHPAPGGRRRDARPERPGQVGDPAGRAAGGRPDDGPRVGRDARSHGADAAGARHRGRDGALGRRSPGEWRSDQSRRRVDGACGRASGFRATSRRPRSGSSRGAIHPDAELTLRGVGVNPTRRAVIDILRAMGADIDERRSSSAPRRPRPTTASASRSPTSRPLGGAPRDRPRARATSPPRSTRSRSCAWPPPRADGTTTIRGAGELRHKESDRIAGIADGLRALGRADRRRRRRPPDPRRPALAARRPTASTTTAWR